MPRDTPKSGAVIAVLSDASARTAKAVRLPARIISGIERSEGLEMMLYRYLPEGESVALPRMGDTIICSVRKIVAREEIANESYKYWLRSKNVAAIADIIPSKPAYNEEKLQFPEALGFVLLPRDKASNIKEFALDLRDKLLKRVDSLPFSSTDKALLAAITLGYRSDDTAQVGEAFRNVGAAHILAVSGFHLAVIVGALWIALSFLDYFPRLRFLKPLFIIIAAWAFALITGLSAPTTRAALMITLYQIGYFMSRPQDSVNLLAFTAMILLLIHPGALFAIGFQLSFVAVLSILLFYHFFTFFLSFRQSNPILRYAYRLVALSISAQLLTLPLILYHFGETPLIFIWSNLPLIALTSLLIPVGIFYLLMSPLLEKMVIVNDWILEVIGVLCAMVQKTLHFFGAVAPDKLEYNPSGLQLFALYLVAAALYIALWRVYHGQKENPLQPPAPRITRGQIRKGKKRLRGEY